MGELCKNSAVVKSQEEKQEVIKKKMYVSVCVLFYFSPPRARLHQLDLRIEAACSLTLKEAQGRAPSHDVRRSEEEEEDKEEVEMEDYRRKSRRSTGV